MNAKILGVLGLLVLCGLVNLVLFAGQKLYHHNDEARLEQLKKELTSSGAALNTMEADLDGEQEALDEMDGRLQKMKVQIEAYEKRKGGLDSAAYSKYSALVKEHNGLVDAYNAKLSEQKADVVEYKAKIAAHNGKVDEANQLAKKLGSYFYIMPIPLGRRAH